MDPRNWFQGINSPVYVARRAGTIILFLFSVPRPHRRFKNSNTGKGRQMTNCSPISCVYRYILGRIVSTSHSGRSSRIFFKWFYCLAIHLIAFIYSIAGCRDTSHIILTVLLHITYGTNRNIREYHKCHKRKVRFALRLHLDGEKFAWCYFYRT
jgi:hypothetical protein